MRRKILKITSLFLPLTAVVIQFFCVSAVFAQTYQLLEPIKTKGATFSGGSLSGYLEAVFAFGISIAGILAVVVLVWGGIEYMTAYGNASQVGRAKDRIYNALLGLLLAICAWLILYTINPDLIKGTLTVPPIISPYSWGGSEQGF